MLFKSFLPLLLLPFAIASPVSLEERANPGDPAGAKTLLADIKTLSKDVVTLNDTVNMLKTGSPSNAAVALQIMQKTTDVENALKQALSDANSTSAFNGLQSQHVAIATLNLVPKIKSLLSNIVVHKPDFALFGVFDISKTVESSLKTQEGLTKQFGAAVKAKLVQSYASLAGPTTKEILGYFKAAIAAYNKCTGAVCLPPFPG